MVIAMHDAKTISFKIEVFKFKKMNFTMFFEFKEMNFTMVFKFKKINFIMVFGFKLLPDRHVETNICTVNPDI